MKLVILAGGLGTRITEETHLRPKPMISIGGMPILWHIMKYYSVFKCDEFIICAGYKSHVIKEFFSNYFIHMCDLTFNMSDNTTVIHNNKVENWKVTIINTGLNTNTGGRLARIKNYVEGEEHFYMTYGDGLSNVNIDALYNFHLRQNTLCTVTATKPPGRFGSIEIQKGRVKRFVEKPRNDGSYINGGFFVLKPKCLDQIKGDASSWEFDVMPNLAEQGELSAYEHDGFWQPMDTLREYKYLESLWDNDKAPWKVW